MSSPNLKNIASIVKESLPFHIREGDYDNFVRFLELYYEWLSKDNNPLDVMSEITDYGDLDKTLDIFVNQFKSELGSVFPAVTRIRSESVDTKLTSSIINSTAESDPVNERFQRDSYIGNGYHEDNTETSVPINDRSGLAGLSEFLLSYREPSYYFGKNISPYVVDIKVYVPTVDVSDYSSSDINPKLRIFDTGTVPSVSIPFDENTYTELDSGSKENLNVIEYANTASLPDTSIAQEGDRAYNAETDRLLLYNGVQWVEISSGKPEFQYYIEDDRLSFVKGTQLSAPKNGQTFVVQYILREPQAASEEETAEEEEKKKFTDQNHFLKLLKDFYESKGSQKSLQFLFRAFLNEDIDVYYPKENLFKASNNKWVRNKSVRTAPNTTSAEGNPVRLIGETSSAVAIIESKTNYTISSFNVNEYFLGDIFGEFQDQENVFVEMDDGRLVREQLYSCVTGFEITNSGKNYPRNRLFYYPDQFSSVGSGSGFFGKIENTTTGEVTSVDIENPGQNYITGEYISFNNDATGGSGAIARISEVDGSDQEHILRWTQEENGISTWRFNQAFGASTPPTYYDQSSREVEAYISNRDSLYDDVVLLYDFDTVKSSSVFYDHKNDLDSERYNAFRRNPNVSARSDGLIIENIIGNHSLSFEGDGYLRVPNVASYLVDQRSFTVDFWFCLDSATSGNDDSIIFTFNDINYTFGSTGKILTLEHLDSGQLRLSGDGVSVTSGDVVPTDKWVNISVIVDDDGKADVYIDGSEVISGDSFSVNMVSDAVLTLGADNDDLNTNDVIEKNTFYGTFRITKGERTLSNYLPISPIQNQRRLQSYEYNIYYDNSQNSQMISYRQYDTSGSLVATPILEGETLELRFKNVGRGPIKKINLITGGSGYALNPIAFVSPKSGNYESEGSGAVLVASGDNIGGIEKILITQDATTPSQDGFGVGYTSAPTLDLTNLGDNTAQVNVITGALCTREGAFINEQSFSSSENRIHDGYLWQDYSYVVRVNRVIDEWRDLIKKVIHPAGMMVFGELTLTTTISSKKMRIAISNLFYEIIKNVELKVKNMDGLGRWTGGKTLDSDGNVVNVETPINAQDLLSNGLIIEYDRRLNYVSDDNFATEIASDGSYALLETPSVIVGNTNSQEIFNSWDRFSHNSSGTFPANSSELNAFVYDSVANAVSCTINSSTYVGFYSPERYTSYDLSMTLSSTNADDDLISVVIAHETDSLGNEHTISLTRSRGGVGDGADAKDYAIIYNLLQSNEQTIFDGNALAPDPTGGGSSDNDGWTGSSGQIYTRVNIIRNGNTFTGSVSQYSTTIPTDSDLDPATAFSFNLEDHSFLSPFGTENSLGNSYGIGCYSQNLATWSDISFTTGSSYINPSTFGSVDKIAINNRDKNSISREKYYDSGLIGNFFTLYNVSDQSIVGSEHKTTRPYAKFEVTGVTSYSDYVLLDVSEIISYQGDQGDHFGSTTSSDVVEFRWDNISRGSVSRINTNWVGSVRDGADPRDEKFILHIITRQQEVPSLGTSYRSLERFKFFFDSRYNFEDLVRYRFSPQEEALDSPYMAYYGYTGRLNKTSMAGNQVMVVKKNTTENVWGVVPAFSQNNFLGVTDFSDHDWPVTTIAEVEDLFDRNYHAVLDSRVILKPKYVVLTDEDTTNDGLRVTGMTNLSIERFKFLATPQLLDNNFEDVILTEIDSKYLEKTNVAHETVLNVYETNEIPTSLDDLKNATQIND